MSSTPAQLAKSAKNYEYKRPTSGTSRSPCPALNTLANHGYLCRGGTDLKFLEVVRAIVLVYNFSYPLAFILTFVGFITCGKVSFNNRILSSVPPHNEESKARASFTRLLIFFFSPIAKALMRLIPSFTLDLDALSLRGDRKIAHDASFVHPNGKPSTSPDPALLRGLLAYALDAKNADGTPKNGLGFAEMALYHAKRCASSAPLNSLHAQVALGECSLTWQMLSTHPGQPHGTEYNKNHVRSNITGVIPVSRLEQWFGEERLPDGWWDEDGVRPLHAVGVVKTKKMANLIDELGR